MKCIGKDCNEETADKDRICIDCRLDAQYGLKKPEDVGLKLVIRKIKT